MDVQYSSHTYFAFYGQLQVFVGIAVGQITAFFFERLKKTLPTFSFLKLAIWLSLNTALHIVFPQYGWIFAIVSFAGFGFYLGHFYSRFGIRKIILGAGIAGIIAAVLFPWASQIDTRWLKVFGVTLFFIAHALDTRTVRFTYLILWILMLAPFSGDWHKLKPRLFAIGDMNLEFVGAPAFSSMLRTEVVKSDKNAFYLMTNGARLALIPTEPAFNKQFTDPVNEMGEAAKTARALVIGSAGGRNIRALLDTRIGEIVANDINPQVFTVVRERFGKATDYVYDNPRVRTVPMDGRRLLQIDETTYDFIFIETLGTATRAGGFSGWIEASMYTGEAFNDMYKRLKPGGRILFSEAKVKFVKQKPSDSFVNRMYRTLMCRPDFHAAEIWIENLDGQKSKLSTRFRALGDDREILHIRKPSSVDPNSVPAYKKKPDVETPECGKSITDDRPYFLNIQFESESIRPVLLFGTAILLTCSVLIWWLSHIHLTHVMAIVSSGAAYTLGISAISGLAAFQLGSPFNVTPFILFLSFSIGFVTYGMFRIVVGVIWAPLVVALLGVASSVFLLSGVWTDVETLPLKIAALFALTCIPMLIFEMPFLYFLRISERRTEVVAYENIGAIAGVLLAVGMRGLIAYSTIYIISILLAACASIYAIHVARK